MIYKIQKRPGIGSTGLHWHLDWRGHKIMGIAKGLEYGLILHTE